MRQLYLILASAVLVAGLTQPAAGQITFRVDMRHQSLAPGDEVVVRGSTPSLGSWKGSDRVLSPGIDGVVYEGAFLVPEVLTEEVYYKFVILGADGREEWEESGNRHLSAGSTIEVLDPVYFSDVETSGLASEITVEFVVDLGEMRFDGRAPLAVGLLGGRMPLSWEVGDAMLLEPTGLNGQWKAAVTFPAATLPDVPFKFAYRIGGDWEWERTSGHINHLLLLEDGQSVVTAHLARDAESERLRPVTNEGSLDLYGEIVAALGERAAKSEYLYYKAVALLEQGRVAEAAAAHDAFTKAHPGGAETDDFHYLHARQLAAGGETDGAIRLLEERRLSESIPQRSAFLRYAQGEILFANGRTVQAREVYVDVIAMADVASDQAAYARGALVHSWLASKDRDSALVAVELLESWLGIAGEDPSGSGPAVSPEEEAQLWLSLARAWEVAGNRPEAIAAYGQVVGRAVGAGRAAFQRMAHLLMREGQADEAARLIDERLVLVRDKEEEARLLLLRSRAATESGERIISDEILTDVVSRLSNTSAAPEAAARLNR